jgi:hypothetical protein
MTVGNVAKFAFALVVLTSGLFIPTDKSAQAGMSDGSSVAVDAKGNIRVPPVDYRKDWAAIGSWSVADDSGKIGAKGIHIVYTQPETIAAFRKDGKFPDGAILIKELLTTATADMTTGTVSRANEKAGWFVMIKDSANRFPGHNLWGDGWGWAFFEADDRNKTTSTDYTTDCIGCNIPAKSNDWIYVEGYPALNSR